MTHMKKYSITILLALVALTGWAQVNPTTALLGSWSGKLKVGTASLTLVLHLEQGDGYVIATFDSPDQGAKGISAFKEFLSDDSLALKVEQIGMTYRARLKDDTLDGTFSQNGMSLPLVMTRGVPEVKRPQTPKEPYPYTTEEVMFPNATDIATLVGTLTWPVGYDKQSKQKPAVVLMVTGSGQQNRDEELMQHKPFLVIADYLARHGIASLRYDDRGFGQSTGDVANATTADFAQDAEAGIRFLRSMNFSEKNGKKTREKPMFSKVGILGHSEGGSVAFMLGARQAVDFIVALAAPGIKGDTLLVEQTNALLQLSGQPAKMTLKQMRLTMAMQETNPWYDFFTEYDPAADIAATKCPVFALNGSLDKQVLPESNLNAIYNLQSTIYNSKPNTQHPTPNTQHLTPNTQHPTIKLYPGLNHLFQHATTGATTEYNHIEETISEEVLRDIAEWIGNLQ